MSDYEAMDYRDGGVGESDDGMSMNDSEMDRVRLVLLYMRIVYY